VRRLRLGTRGSRLALVQSETVAARLREAGAEVELVTVRTEGDDRQSDTEIGEGMFVTALERELMAGHVDLAVHSAKDVPLETHAGLLPPREAGFAGTQGLVVAAYPERADPRDALVTARGGATLELLPYCASVGTDSPRRAAFTRAVRPDAFVRPVRGNVDTRLRRLDDGHLEALVLAAAGLDRLGQGHRADQRLDPAAMAPAPGQGALAVQCRAADPELRRLLAGIEDHDIRMAVTAERLVLEATGGTCRSPVGALGTVKGGRLHLLAAAASADGSQRHVLELESEAVEEAARRLALAAGRELLEKVVSLVGGIAR
jgi:hydroxymethylbilane synthase